MQDLIDFLGRLFKTIGGMIWDALTRYWDFVQGLLETAASWLMSQFADLMPDTAQNLPSTIIDYFEVGNYYFPVRELFVLIAIYLQFRLALFIVRMTVKLMTGGQV